MQMQLHTAQVRFFIQIGQMNITGNLLSKALNSHINVALEQLEVLHSLKMCLLYIIPTQKLVYSNTKIGRFHAFKRLAFVQQNVVNGLCFQE